MAVTAKYRRARQVLAQTIQAEFGPVREADPEFVVTHDAEWIAERLLDWLNISTPDQGDLDRLMELLKAGGFDSWDCPSCGQPCHEADPQDWSHFQGVCQLDRVSYPGNRHTQKCCDHCRCYDKRPKRSE